MTAICYNDKDAYANLGYDNWPSEKIGSPLLPVYAALLTTAYTPNPNPGGDGVFADVSAKESSALGYTAGGQQVSIHNTMGANFEDWIKAREPIWTIGDAVNPTTLACRYVAYYILGTVKTRVNPLIAYQDVGSQRVVLAGGHTSSFAVRENDAVVTSLTTPEAKSK